MPSYTGRGLSQWPRVTEVGRSWLVKIFHPPLGPSESVTPGFLSGACGVWGSYSVWLPLMQIGMLGLQSQGMTQGSVSSFPGPVGVT